MNKTYGAVWISLDCTVGDAGVLWTKAASAAARTFGMARDDIEQTIGPREDPDVHACASMLIDELTRRSSTRVPTTRLIASTMTSEDRAR